MQIVMILFAFTYLKGLKMMIAENILVPDKIIWCLVAVISLLVRDLDREPDF